MPIVEGTMKAENTLPVELTNQLNVLVDLIAAEPGVSKIMLFGSTATGHRTRNSDIDLLVLLENNAIDRLSFSASIRLKAFDLISFPLDLVVETVSEFQERSVLPTLERVIAREGKVLYAA
jgi:predicted nucleotidyltransferase